MTMATAEEQSTTSADDRLAESQSAPSTARERGFDWLAYVEIARPDHWFKNVFMLIGVVLAMFCQEGFSLTASLGNLIVGFIATCIVASSNYVINEILDAPMDRHHPVKRNRPISTLR